MSLSIPQDSIESTEPRRRRRCHVARLSPRFWHCPNCTAVTAIEAREGHICPIASPVMSNSAPFNDTPLDRFFSSYPSFEYDRSLPPAESFNRLRRNERWKRGSPESNEAWNQYQKALKEEFQLWYGAEDDLSAWHALCRAIRIKPLPATCEESEKAVRHRHVNLIDLIEWGRNGGESGGKKVRIFRSVKELSHYSKDTHKIFRNDLDEDAEEGGVVLRHLLRRLFNKRPL